jgi:predicted histone-like DNA-binding protein
MVRYVLKQNKNEESKVFGKWFAYPLIEETLNLDSLAEHMSNHNSPYSKGVIKGLLTDMISCIKELLLEGKNVKVDDLAIFSLGIKNKKGGAASEDEFNISKNIDGVKLRARATGILVAKALHLEATLKKATAVTGKQTTGTGGESGEEDPSSSSNSGSGYPPVINP